MSTPLLMYMGSERTVVLPRYCVVSISDWLEPDSITIWVTKSPAETLGVSLMRDALICLLKVISMATCAEAVRLIPFWYLANSSLSKIDSLIIKGDLTVKFQVFEDELFNKLLIPVSLVMYSVEKFV